MREREEKARERVRDCVYVEKARVREKRRGVREREKVETRRRRDKGRERERKERERERLSTATCGMLRADGDHGLRACQPRCGIAHSVQRVECTVF